jgi:uncharacterized membrane protein (UPF0127 family)
MDVEHLKRKLHPELKPEPRLKDKLNKYSTVIRISVGILLAIALITLILLVQAPKKVEGVPQACFKHDVCVDLIIVTTPEAQEIGLSNYSSLPQGAGMLFIFDKPGIQRIWMKDMKFSIDIIWIDKNNRITHIEKSADPCIPPQCMIYEPPGLAKYVLEVRSDFAKDDNLFDNDIVELKNIPE